MKVRYTGDSDEKALAFPGGFVLFPRMKWVDVGKALDEALIDRHHLDIVLAGLGEEWETESKSRKAAKQEDDQ
ncbi:MAG TPA: hypothetical protein VD864_01005 [Nocardioides sp.]|nr:hypothetical protein [Nocardioides sp.]